MHGTEHRVRKLRAFRLSTPRQPFSPATDSSPQGSPQISSEQSRSLTTTFPSPERPLLSQHLSRGHRSRRVASLSSPTVSATRSAFPLHNPCPVCTRIGLLHCVGPVAASTTGSARRPHW